MAPSADPPRLFGTLLTLLGIGLALGGISLIRSGDSPYFLVVGLGIAAAGVLIALGKVAGARLYMANLALIVLWSIVDRGSGVSQVFSQTFLPAAIGVYIHSEHIRSRLS